MRKNFIKRSSLRKNYIRFTAEVLSAIAVSGLLVGAVNTPNVMAATEHFNDASSESSKWDKWKTNWGEMIPPHSTLIFEVELIEVL